MSGQAMAKVGYCAKTPRRISHSSCDVQLRSTSRPFVVGARSWKHVVDLTDLTFRLQRRGVEFWDIHLAGGVLKVPNIHPQKLLCIGLATARSCRRRDPPN